MTRLRKTLSKEFLDFYYGYFDRHCAWSSEDIEKVKTMLEKCEPNAYIAASNKETVLFLFNLPIEIMEWSIDRGTDVNWTTPWGNALFPNARLGNTEICQLLIERGIDVNAESFEGRTALHSATKWGMAETIRILLEHGADPCKKTVELYGGNTALLELLANMEGMIKPQYADAAELLLNAERNRRPIPANEWKKARKEVERIGHQYQVFRADWKEKEEIKESDAAIEKLYALFQVTPAREIKKHDGIETIKVDENLTPEKQFQQVYEYLVPIADEPLTLQGEVIRIAGAVHNEVSGNGGMNWNRAFNQMLNQLIKYFQYGNSLNRTDMFIVEELIQKIIKNKGYLCWDETEKLCRYAVQWVKQNREPITA